ncbi:DNA-binding response regulator [Bacillus clarus]|uniref:Response regulator n=1 Tax=Bacillus clarus TaxID=2338372 RepID=A0A090Y8V2_9BACI|nr:response regulator transcription factor [Bacillus clarus]KFM95203.1 response regulator [Bacillus clarus]RFT63442.1 DNA-binding response regulator [Bacillus clarus]
MSTILVLEDEIATRSVIVLNMKGAGFNVLEADTGEAALELLSKYNIDVVLLDVMLPGIDGFQVCKSIRENNEKIGIIMLSTHVQDKVQCLLIGADDYIEKPLSLIEVNARVQALLRRIKVNNKKMEFILSKPFILNLQQEKLYKEGIIIDLTPTEYVILEYLMKNQNKPISRGTLLNKIWGENYVGETKVVDVNISRLRQKVESDPSKPQFLITVWGKGYTWKESEY